jgi:predicted transcriptional regulator
LSEAYFDAENRRRSRLEVKISILRAIDEGATRQTQVMYRSNLSWSFAKTFIRILERQGLISTAVLKGKKNFMLTDRGKRALATYTAVTTELNLNTMRKKGVEEAKETSSEIENVVTLSQD